MKTRSILIFSLVTCISLAFQSTASAQDDSDPESSFHHWDIGADFMVGVPQGGFRQNVDNPGFGVDMFAVYHMGDFPLGIGLDIGFVTYGTTRRDEPFNPNIPEVTVRVSTSNNIVFGHLMARVQPLHGTVQPYIDGLIGLNYLFTESRVSDDRDTEDIASTTNFEDVAFSSGLAAGTKIRITETRDSSSGRMMGVYLDLRARYLMGGEAEYLQEGSIIVENGQMRFDIDRSRTDLMTFHVGFSISI